MPHARMPDAKKARIIKTPRRVCHFFLRGRVPNNNTVAKIAPPVAYIRPPMPLGSFNALVVAAVVVTVRTAVTAPVPDIRTGLVEPKLSEGRLAAFVGLEMIFAVNITVPVKSPAGVTTIWDVLPVVAPEVRLGIDVPLMAKLAGVKLMV